MANQPQYQPYNASLVDSSREFHNPFIVKRFTDLLALGGLWVAVLLIGQVAMAAYLAHPVGKYLALPAVQVGVTLGVVYLSLDVVVYLVLRGRMIFQWMVPALCVAAAVVVPGLLVYLVEVLHKL
ncbi:MAG: hypothetical protein WCJ14_07570 [Verrucomicrobiota bacterium]